MIEYIECKLGDLITFQRGYDLPKASMKGGKYPVVGSNGIIGFHDKYTTEAPSITIGRSGNVGKPFIYYGKTWSHNTTLYIKEFKNVDPIFIYYYLKTLDLGAYAGGSAVPTLNRNHIHTLTVKIPKSISVQKEIGEILKELDDKIALNIKINQNLQRQAQALYKSWFIDFDPFEGEQPHNWKQGTIVDLAQDIICGKTPSTKKKEYYGEEIPFVTIPDMHGNVYITKTERYLSHLGARSQTSKTLDKNCVCVSCIGTAGLVSLISEESQTNQQINSIVPKKEVSPYYVYLLMQTLSDTINKLGQSGSTIVNLNKAQFSKIEVLIPTETIMKAFDNLLTPIFESILENQRQNEQLSVLRDTLLPKLMSGELDISTINI